MQVAGRRRGGRIVVVGSGIGGLAAGALLAASGCAVTIVEAADAVGGKLRQAWLGAIGLDAGPTVFTMRWVFDELFAALGTRLDDQLALTPATTLARHAWPDGSRLDLLADRADSAQAIADFAGRAEADRFLRFCDRAGAIYGALEPTFLRAPRPRTPLHLAARFGLRGLPRLAAISPFRSMWAELARAFTDPRLQQLFGRYATYCGSSPFAAPATLVLVAHVEQQGVWLVEGDMARLAEALASQAARHGAELRVASPVRQVLVEKGRATGVQLATGERLGADAVVFNGDAAALDGGLLGPALQRRAPAGTTPSLSAVTWHLLAERPGFPLHRHNVFFSGDSKAEFAELFQQRRLPSDPTVYLCAQDRDAPGRPSAAGERIMCLVNAPAGASLQDVDLRRLEDAANAQLLRHGVDIDLAAAGTLRTTPADFAARYPGTGGALYGRASHGWRASFERPTARTAVRGLYRAGGSTHPGAGVPMAALSGRLAAAAVLEDLAR